MAKRSPSCQSTGDISRSITIPQHVVNHFANPLFIPAIGNLAGLAAVDSTLCAAPDSRGGAVPPDFIPRTTTAHQE